MVTAHVSARFEDVSRRHQRGAETVVALEGVSFDIHEGELLFIMGPSGSGKSTLLHLLGGLDRPSGGQVWLAAAHVNGQDGVPRDELINLDTLDDRALSRLRRTRLGFVFQSFNLLPTLTTAENVALPLILDGRPERDARRRAEELLQELGLGHRLGHVAEELSGGERQRVAIARALAPQPELILADEPTGNLDSVQGRGILQVLRDLVDREGRTVVVVTHDVGAAEMADRVLRLHDGHLAKAPV